MKRTFLTLAAAGLIAVGGFAVVQAQGRHGGGRGHGLEEITEGLNLTPDQRAKVQPILDQARPQVAAIHHECMQKMKAIMGSTVSQIRPLLTPEQQQKLDQNEKRHHGRMNGPKGSRDEDED